MTERTSREEAELIEYGVDTDPGRIEEEPEDVMKIADLPVDEGRYTTPLTPAVLDTIDPPTAEEAREMLAMAGGRLERGDISNPYYYTAQVYRLARAYLDVLAERDRLHTWDGLMALLNEHYPEDIFPTLPDSPRRDPGPRIVSLIRTIDRLRSPPHDRADDALDWLMEWALAEDHEANAHYWHICDGKAATCGCKYEGEGIG